jgi:hypothetical protein
VVPQFATAKPSAFNAWRLKSAAAEGLRLELIDELRLLILIVEVTAGRILPLPIRNPKSTIITRQSSRQGGPHAPPRVVFGTLAEDIRLRP